MYIAMPSPNGTNKAGLFLPASRFASAAAAYDSKHGLSRRALRAYDQMATQPNSGQPWNLADDDETEKFGLGRRVEDDEDDETNGEDPVHEIMRRARAAGLHNDCGQLRNILGRLLMAEKARAEEEDEDAENEAAVASRSETNGDKRRRMGRDEPLLRNAAEGGIRGATSDRRHAKDVRRAQDAAWLQSIAYDAVRKHFGKDRLAAIPARKKTYAQDAAAAADFAERHPEVARIKVLGGYDAPALPRNLSARYAAPTPRIAYDEASDRDFAERHPEVARIRVIG